MAQQTDPRILGTEKIGKLLLQYSIPAIIGMTITSLYNIIDSIFIGHGVGAMAISGLAITFPLMNLVVAFCVLISMRWCHYFIHPAGSERYRRSYGSIRKYIDVVPYQLGSIRRNRFSFSGSDIKLLRCQSGDSPVCTRFHASYSVGNSRHLYHDRPEQCDARHRIS